MTKSPFTDDPRDEMRRHIAEAMTSPIEAVRAIHLRAAEHHARLADDHAALLGEGATKRARAR